MIRYTSNIVLVTVGLLLAASSVQAAQDKPSLKEALAQLKTPPDWFDTTRPQWDMTKPWKDARLEVRRLLAMADQPERVREAVKITWTYKQKGDIGDGHEWPMYLFMSGNYAWAAREYPAYLLKVRGNGPTHAYLGLVSCYTNFREYDKALETLDQAMKDLQPAPWRINSTANIQSAFGDVYAQMGRVEKAREAYAEAMRLYPTSTQPYGRQLLHRQVAKVKTKLDMLDMQSLQNATLRNGTYIGRSLGYSDKQDIEVTVKIAAGKIADIKVNHQEKIELNAVRIIPQQIIARQSLKVDMVTGATVTSQAIIDGAFQAVKQAGAK